MYTNKCTGGSKMKYAKGLVITVLGKETYVVVGKWSGGYVLAPQDEENTEVLIYTAEEIEDELAAGRFAIKN